MNFLECTNLVVGYFKKPQPIAVAGPLNLSLNKGSLTCLIGENGVGKSTLLSCLSGLSKPLEGACFLNGESVHSMPIQKRAKLCSIVLPERVDLPHFSVYELVALGRHPHTGFMGQLRHQDEVIILDSLKAVAMESFVDRQSSELSDGEKQKVMIARALAQQSPLMVLDEPTAFLDLPNRYEIMELLKALCREKDCAIVMSTHDLDLALRLADHLWLMPQGQAIVSGSAHELESSGALENIFAHRGLAYKRTQGWHRK